MQNEWNLKFRTQWGKQKVCEHKLPQCPNLIDLECPQWTRFLVRGNGALSRLQTKQTP